jgi:hypothetical protein
MPQKISRFSTGSNTRRRDAFQTNPFLIVFDILSSSLNQTAAACRYRFYRTMRNAFISFFALALLFITGVVAAQEPPAAPPVDTSRVLHTFDFEERHLGNDEDVPMYWQKVEGVDFPHYVNGRLTTDKHRSGRHSFRMDLDGGNCTYRYEPGRIRVQSGARYRIEGYCQTTVLAHARARLTAYLTDIDLHPIPSSVHHSELYACDGSNQDWHLMSVELTATAPEAVFLVVQMELLQPGQFATTSLGQRSLFLEDIHGTAWFDDISIAQVPEVKLSTDRPCNIFHKSDAANLFAQVDDRSADDLTVQLIVTDARGRRVYQHTGDGNISSTKVLGPGLRRLTLPLPAVEPGWYRATMVTMSHGVFVGQQSLDWIRLADDDPAAMPDPRFGMIATQLPFDCWPELPDLLPYLAVGRVKLALWDKTGDVQQVDSATLDRMFDRLREEGVHPTGCLVALPPKLAKTVNGTSWLQLLGARDDDWQDPLSFLISRNANHVDRWQLGADGTEDFASNPDMRKVYARIYARFAGLLDKPDLAMPYPVWYELPAPAPLSIALSVPTSIAPDEIPLYLQEYRGRESANVSVSLSTIDRDVYGRDARLRDLVQRIVCSLAGGATHIDLPLPVEARQRGERLSVEPRETAIVERTLLSTLSGASFRGKLPLADDIDAYLFDKSGQGILVLWDKNDVTEAQPLAVNLGEHPARVDLWGNVDPLLRSNQTDPDLVQLQVGRMPIILTGVDSEMGQLRASVAFDHPLIESTFEAHARHIRFTNPYSLPIGGTLRLRPPLGWTMNPPTFNFTLNPGETFDQDVAIEIPYNSVAGRNVVHADFDLQSDHHSRFTVPIDLTLGLSDVGTQAMACRDGKDVVVQQMISNYGDQSITYSAFASFPGRPRVERLVSSLLPGQTVIKKYRFSNVPPGKSVKVRVGLKEVEGPRILNDEVVVK